MKIYLISSFNKIIPFLIFSISLVSFRPNILFAEESLLKEIEIDSSTKLDSGSSKLPSNPFEIVDMLRRANSMNNATKPSDAIDDALESFNSLEVKEEI